METFDLKQLDIFDNNTFQDKSDSFAHEETDRKNIKNKICDITKKYSEYLNFYFDYSVLHKDISDENKINAERESYLHKKVTNQFIETILEESFEFGIKSKSELIIEEQLSINALVTRNWLNEIFIDFFDDEKIIIGILRIIGRFDESIIFPQGQTIALAALNHTNTEIKELGIRAFENWGSFNSINILDNVDLDVEWINDYKKQVIEDLKEELYVSHSQN